MYPGQVTTVVVRFAPTNLSLSTSKSNLVFGFDPSVGPGYVWHCHIIDHEDNEMMRPYTVSSNPLRSASPSIASVANENISTKTSPVSYNIQQNYPNPFNPSTVIRFSIPKDEFVTLKIYDILGREVGTLLNQVIPGGSHEVRFDGSKLSSGIYIYTLRSGSFTRSFKMVLAK